MKTVLITGGRGFIARNIAAELKKEGIKTIAVSRTPDPIEGFEAVYPGRLGVPLAEVFDVERVDVIIHCSNHVGRDDLSINVKGTIIWAEQAKENNVGLQIFLSSISAKRDSISSYGQSKYLIERWFLVNTQIVFRLGLVIGNGGIFGKMVDVIRRYPVVPLIDNGRLRTYITGIDFLCKVIKDVLCDGAESLKGRIWHMQQPEPVTLRKVMEAIRIHFGYSCLFLPIPSLLLLPALLFIEKLPFLKLDISSNNVRGLRQNAREEFSSDFAKFGYPTRSLNDMVKYAAENCPYVRSI